MTTQKTEGKADLIHLREGRAALERARANGEIREIKRIHDIAAAAKRFAEAQGMAEESKRYAAEMELDAKRYLGEVLAKQDKHPGGRPSENRSNGPTGLPLTLKDLGITKDESSQAQKLATLLSDEDYEQFKASAQTDTLNTKRALRVAREKESERRRDEVADTVVLPSSIEVRHGDLRDTLDDLAGQVDAIITDPPYPAEFISEFDALGEVAIRLLKPDGILVAMVGQTHLPAYLNALGEWLTYRWCGAYLTDGPATRIHGRLVGTKWKPLLIYGGERFITQDVFASRADDKEHHHWGQSESGIADIVERLTEPGDLVVDPFLGGGTTGVVCEALGRRFVGCDIDSDAVATTRARLHALQT